MSSSSLFRRPFSPKKAPPRKATTISPLQMDAAERSREFGLDFNHAHMLLGTQHFQFDPENGEWFDDLTGHYYTSSQLKISQQSKLASNKDLSRLQRENNQVQEENNLLRVKNEILLDMVAEICSEYRLETTKKKGNK